MLKQIVPSMLVIGLLLASAAPATTAGDSEAPDSDPVHIELNQWDGFLACSLGTPVLLAAVCSLPEYDLGDDFLHTFTVQEDLRTIVVAMEWEPGMMVGSENLSIILEDEGSGVGSPSILRAEGASPVEFRVDVGEDWDPEILPWGLQFRVFPTFEVSLVLQQPFTVHYHEFYGAHAPDGYSALG